MKRQRLSDEERIAREVERLNTRASAIKQRQETAAEETQQRRLQKAIEGASERNSKGRKAIDEEFSYRRRIIEEERDAALSRTANGTREQRKAARAFDIQLKNEERERTQRYRQADEKANEWFERQQRSINQRLRQRQRKIGKDTRERVDGGFRKIKEATGVPLKRIREVAAGARRRVQEEGDEGVAPQLPKPSEDELREAEERLRKHREGKDAIPPGGPDDGSNDLYSGDGTINAPFDPWSNPDGWDGGGFEEDRIRRAEAEINVTYIVEDDAGSITRNTMTIDRKVWWTEWDIAKVVINALPIKEYKRLKLFITAHDWITGEEAEFEWTKDDYERVMDEEAPYAQR